LNVYEVLEIYKYSGEIIPDALQRLRGAYLSSAKYISNLNADSKFWLLGKDMSVGTQICFNSIRK
jgi:hypothetical protein